jgi:hypothetical protein
MRTWPAVDVRVAGPDEADLLEAFFLDHELAAIEEPAPDARRYFFRTPGATPRCRRCAAPSRT